MIMFFGEKACSTFRMGFWFGKPAHNGQDGRHDDDRSYQREPYCDQRGYPEIADDGEAGE